MSCSNYQLNLPTDIPWERICVTEDMMDRVVCDERLPAKWQTSLAVFKYKPDDDYQNFPDYDITYLKVTATITGYQPLDSEIQGEIDWDGVNVETVPGLTDLLNSYNPCHGAILQLVVGPKKAHSRIPLKKYPFFIDFEPKKRELYELATDTQEKQSRSIESLNIKNSSGSTQSMEVLDIDMGSSFGFGAQGSYAGTGGGFNVSSSSQGQWGTKRLNAEESMSARTTDVGQEKRESFSHSTQLSQMYHLLDSYHLGTNRVVFFIQPRPHVLEEPSGFVRGPRPVDGIQEFFAVVAQPKKQDDFCVSLRLDTSHITRTPILEYDRKSETTQMASVTAPVASKHDIPDGTIVGARACFLGSCWDVHYHCYRTEANQSITYNAPSGYRIESYNNLVNDVSHGSTNVVVTPNGASLNINVEASGHICYEGDDVCINCPDEIRKWAGHARRQIQVNLVSTEPIVQVGEEEVLLITTRGLCCCPSDSGFKPMIERVVGVKKIPPEFSLTTSTKKLNELKAKGYIDSMSETVHLIDDLKAMKPAQLQSTEKVEAEDSQETGRNAIRRANELSNYIRTETIKSLNDPTVKLQRYIDTQFFESQLEFSLKKLSKGRALLAKSPGKLLSNELLAKLGEYLDKDKKAITRQDLLSIRTDILAKIFKMKEQDVQRLKLKTLGISFKKRRDSDDDN